MKNSLPLLRIAALGLCCLLLQARPLSAQDIVVDGVFFDWDASQQVDVGAYEELTFADGDPQTPDPNNTSYWLDLDIRDVYVHRGSDSLYVRVSLNPAANITNTASDTSYHGGGQLVLYFDLDNSNETGLTWDWWASGYDVFTQVYPTTENNRLPIFEHTQEGNGWGWMPMEDTTAVHAVWNAEFNDVEVAVPLSYLRQPVNLPSAALGDSLAIMVFASEPEAPWRADTAPSAADAAGLPIRIAETATAIDDRSEGTLPERFRLLGAYPNPFNPSTTIRFELDRAAPVTVQVFDLLGRQVDTVLHGMLEAGRHDVRFDAGPLVSGTYLYRVETDRQALTGMMTLLK